MPQAEYTAIVAAPIDKVWAFVADMDNWAPFLRGYQSHEHVSESESIWHLKGELGGLTRVADFRVRVKEWNGPERVAFELEGLTEAMTGYGSFRAASGSSAADVSSSLKPAGPIRRFLDWLGRLVIDRILPTNGSKPVNGNKSVPIVAVPSGDSTTVTLNLALSAPGTSGPIIDLLMAPLLRPVAVDLVNEIARSLGADSVPSEQEPSVTA